VNQLYDEDGEEVINLADSPVVRPARRYNYRSRQRDRDQEYELDSDDTVEYDPEMEVTDSSAGSFQPHQHHSSIEIGSASGSGAANQFNSPAGSNSELESAIAESQQMDLTDEDEEEQIKKVIMQTAPSSQSGNETITDDAVMCPICFDAWSSDGPHRIVSLKCGHVYGLSCIEKWLNEVKKTCPNCNQSIRRTDIRYLFVSKLKALDTSERDALTKVIAEKDKRITELDSQISSLNAFENLQVKLAQDELNKLKKENEHLKRELIQCKDQLSGQTRLPLMPSVKSVAAAHCSAQMLIPGRSHEAHKAYSDKSRLMAAQFTLVKYVEVCGDGGCRVMASCRDMDTIAISIANPNPLFPGHGVRRINLFNYSLSDFIQIHAEAITDMCFKPYDPLLLSVSSDKTMKLTSLIDKSVVTTFNLPAWGRSCCWHPSDSVSCFVGLNNGSVMRFDIRDSSAPTHIYNGLSGTPLISIHFLSKEGAGGLDESFSGLFCNSLNSGFFYEIDENSDLVSQQVMPVTGNFLPSHYDNESGFGLMSVRPTERYHITTVTHHVVQLKKERGTVTAEVAHKFTGGKKSDHLSKSKLFSNPSTFDQKPYVFAIDEQNTGIMLFDVTTGRMSQMIKSDMINQTNAVMDIALVSSSSEKMRIAALTAKGILFYDKQFAY
jgi:E3 ubiquitin-protein ligase RFWD3